MRRPSRRRPPAPVARARWADRQIRHRLWDSSCSSPCSVATVSSRDSWKLQSGALDGEQHGKHEVPAFPLERIFEESGAAISPSAVLSLSRCLISFALTTRVDRAQRHRKTAPLPDPLHPGGRPGVRTADPCRPTPPSTAAHTMIWTPRPPSHPLSSWPQTRHGLARHVSWPRRQRRARGGWGG